MQEVLLRAWRALAEFRGRSSLRAWLYRIATNQCLNLIESRSRRVLPVDLGPSVDETPAAGGSGSSPIPRRLRRLIEPDSPWGVTSFGRSLELAFVAALQYLPPNQRAALILRDVLGFSARDAAEVLGAATTAVNSALQHARKTVEQRVPEPSQQTTLRNLGDAGVRRVVERYVRALEEADVDAVVSMLAEEATWSMPPCCLVPRSGRDQPVSPGQSVHRALAAPGHPCQRTAGSRLLRLGRRHRGLLRRGPGRADLERRADHGSDCLHRLLAFPQVPPPLPAGRRLRAGGATVTTLQHHKEQDALVFTLPREHRHQRCPGTTAGSQPTGEGAPARDGGPRPVAGPAPRTREHRCRDAATPNHETPRPAAADTAHPGAAGARSTAGRPQRHLCGSASPALPRLHGAVVRRTPSATSAHTEA